MDVRRAELSTGVTLEYVFARSAEERPVLCFVHGLGPNLIQFTEQLEFFRRSYDVLLLSLRGHGGSSSPARPSPAEYTVQAYASDVQALAEYLGLDEIHLVGNSMGGMIGYELLRSGKPRLASLATFGTAARLRAPRPVLWAYLALYRLLGQAGLAWLIVRTVSRSREVGERLGAMYRATPIPTLALTMRNIIDFDYTDMLRTHDIPYLLIRCELDGKINGLLGSTMAAIEGNPRAEIRELAGGGHFANMEQPEAFNALLADFLRRAAHAAPRFQASAA